MAKYIYFYLTGCCTCIGAASLQHRYIIYFECTCLSAAFLTEDVFAMNKKVEIAVGKNIRLLREKKDITQEQLAAKLQINGCDITRSAVAKIEVGQRHLYPDEVILIKQILGVSYDDIFNIKKKNTD